MSPITNRIFLALNITNINTSKASPDAIDIKKLAGEICGETLLKYYIGCKKWINEWKIALWLDMSDNTKILQLSGPIKLQPISPIFNY